MEPPQRQLVLLDEAPAEAGGHARQGRARAEQVLIHPQTFRATCAGPGTSTRMAVA